MYKEFLHNQGIKSIKTYFMPIIDLKTNKLVSVEALARFFGEENYLLDSFEIISEAEKSDVINEIFYHILDDSCKFAKETKLPVAVNLSPKQINDNKFLYHEIMEIIEDNFTPKNLIEFEITENIQIKDFSICNNFIYKLKKHGIKFSLDDFGTGYNHIETLKELLLDKVKIDKSLTIDLKNNHLKQEIVKNLAKFCEEKNLEITAEGVENQEQVKTLIDYNCQYGQGYLFSFALDKKSFLEKYK